MSFMNRLTTDSAALASPVRALSLVVSSFLLFSLTRISSGNVGSILMLRACCCALWSCPLCLRITFLHSEGQMLFDVSSMMCL